MENSILGRLRQPLPLGERIRALRKTRGFSLEQLAARSRVALATLSRIENGKGSGTFRTHQKLADAFGLSIPELYRSLRLEEPEAGLLEPRSEEAETFIYDEKSSAVFLAKHVSVKQMLPQMIILRPDGKTSMEQFPAGTERWALSLEGTAVVTVGSKEYRLTPGSTLYFKASRPHRFENKSERAAKLISVTSPVIF